MLQGVPTLVVEIYARSIISEFFHLMQPRQPHIKMCKNSNSFFSKKRTKTIICFYIIGCMFPEKSSFMPTKPVFIKSMMCAIYGPIWKEIF